MSASKLLARASAVALFASFLTACGGGGGGGGSGGSPGTGAGTTDNLAVIDRGNAKQFGGAYSKLLDLGSDALYAAPQLISQLASASSGGSIDETYDCDSGTVRISGSVNSANIGTITLDYKDCVQTDYYNYNYSFRYSGSVRITTRAFSGGYPTAFDYHYENYRYQLAQFGIDYSYSGDFSVDPDAAGVKLSASVKITDNRTQNTVESINYAAVYNGTYLPVRTSGQLKQSQLGTVSITGDSEHIYLSGKQGILRIDSANPNAYYVPHLAFDSNNDSAYESFGMIPWSLLDAENATNTAPIVNVSNPGLQPQSNQDVWVPINGVSDVEYDLLSYSVQVLQSPGNGDIQLTLHEDQAFSFHTGSNGAYVFALTVDDGRGGVTTQNIAFHIALPAPIAPAITGNEIVSGALFTASLQPGNLEAGPFTYQLIDGPAGMTIDNQGNLRWQTGGIFFDRAEMQASVKISNADHDVTVPVDFSVTDSNRKPIVRTGTSWAPTFDRNAHILDFNNDGTSRTLLTDNKNLIHTLKFQGGAYVEDWVYPYALTGNGTIDSIVPIDVDHDGNYEIAVQIGGKIFVINEAHDGVARTADLNFARGYGLRAADIDNDGKQELIALVAPESSYTQVGVVLDAATLSEKWRTPSVVLGYDLAVGNVDNDPALELVFAGGYVYDGATQTNQWARSPGFGGKVVVGDVDGDGVDEIVAVNTNEYNSFPTAYSAVSKSALWSITDEQYTCGLGLVELENDNAKEIVQSLCNFAPAIRAFDATGSGTTLKWSRFQASGTMNFVAGDIDGDGDVDLLQFNPASVGAARVNAIVMDAGSGTILFNGAGDFSGNFTGAIPSTQNSARQILFSTLQSSVLRNGVTLLALDPVTEAIVPSPIIESTSYQSPEICVADYDGDSSDDIYFSASENYNSSFLESYSLATQSQLWRKTTSSSQSPSLMACRDFNNDGHVDVALYQGSMFTLSIEDPVNQSLIWSTLEPGVVSLTSGDTDGDGKPELFTATNTTVKKFGPSGSSYVNEASYSIPQGMFYSTSPLLSATDIDGDQRPEIIVAVPNNFWLFGQPTTTTLIVLNSNLTERSRAVYAGSITGIAPEHIGSGRILATTAENTDIYSNSVSKHRTALIDVASGKWLWRSPLLLGAPMPNSLHYDASAPNGGSISIGTSAAMYITR